MLKSILLFFLLTITSFAQYITPDTGINWNMDDLVSNSGGVVTGSFPNYEVNNNVVISLSDQINIAPGSIISFTSADAGFEVNGIINCQGTKTDSILFTSPLADSTGSYTGLKFNESANSSNSIISYTKIEYADNGMRCINSSPTLTHSFILKCNNGAQLTGSNSEISYCRIERNYGYGITMTLTSSPLIKNNIIANNNTQNTSPKNQISIGLQGNNSPVIMDNIIYGSVYEKTGGISLWVNGSTNFSNMVVEGNTIYNNSFGITLYSTGDGIINAIVKNNSIYDNNINPSQLTSGSGININGSPSNTPIITGNEIYGNWWGITIQNGTTIQPGPQPNIGNIENADTTDDGNNIIYDNIQGTDVYDLYNNTTTDIMAQNNDWHVYDSTAIEDHIFHHVDDPQLGYVIFVPFYEVVPVEFTSFSSTVMKNKVQLNWSTATEKNNKGFEIERIKKEKLKIKKDWKKIGFVEGNGTATNQNSYSFVDNDVSAGSYSYRLKQIDFDGSFKYSKVIEANINLPAEFSLEQNYPNPFNPSTNIGFRIAEFGLVILKIYDVLGNDVATLVNKEMEPGNYNVKFDASNFTSGLYFYSLKTKSFYQVKKMMLVK